MSTFEERYFPLKKPFIRRSSLYRRTAVLSAGRHKSGSGDLRLFHISFPSPIPEVKGRKIAFVSDWHWHGSPRNFKLLDEFISLIKEQQPDILLLGGDLCDDAEFLHCMPDLLNKISSLAPVTAAVNGNWETGKRWLKPDFFSGMLEKYGIKFLENNSIITGNFQIYGLPDISSLEFRNLPPPEKFPHMVNILLAHSPDCVISADTKDFLKDFSLAFCGHTHGGQIRLPLFGALYCPSFYRTKFADGIFERDDSDFKMIISRGIGEHCHTTRLFCPPETIILEFC